MDFKVNCSDGQQVEVPHYAVNYSFFFHQFVESLKDGYWEEKEKSMKIEESQKNDEKGDQLEK